MNNVCMYTITIITIIHVVFSSIHSSGCHIICLNFSLTIHHIYHHLRNRFKLFYGSPLNIIIIITT